MIRRMNSTRQCNLCLISVLKTFKLSLDLMIYQKHDLEVEGICALEQQLRSTLPRSMKNYSIILSVSLNLVAELDLMTQRFRASLHTPDVDLHFSKIQILFEEIDDRTNLRRRLRGEGAYDPEQIIEEVAVPITHYLMAELNVFRCSPVLAAFDAFSLDAVPNDIAELHDHKKEAMVALARHYGRPRIDVFGGQSGSEPGFHRGCHYGGVQTLKTSNVAYQFFHQQQDPQPDLYQHMATDDHLKNVYPVMCYFVGLGRIIPPSTAAVERVFSLMNDYFKGLKERDLSL
ncbi:hypothetical protein MAR_026734 [Mya arenaria]|uniref:HAT C-terminal dimerisation domain-containing protein n=1 Tax=Mya arenaria TaxID=6604 RepID=A0ABY7ETX2_MYAAR|nr:hypothetical protein MAR_026734 [Mya arenaria]